MSNQKSNLVLTTCPDCGVTPGKPHEVNCDVERRSVCGEQRLQCDCEGHDRAFARWTRFWPGQLESQALHIDINIFYKLHYHKIFFIKPELKEDRSL